MGGANPQWTRPVFGQVVLGWLTKHERSGEQARKDGSLPSTIDYDLDMQVQKVLSRTLLLVYMLAQPQRELKHYPLVFSPGPAELCEAPVLATPALRLNF